MERGLGEQATIVVLVATARPSPPPHADWALSAALQQPNRLSLTRERGAAARVPPLSRVRESRLGVRGKTTWP